MMSKKEIAIEFARRAQEFHPDEEPMKIRLWGLFSWEDVSPYIKSGEIIPNSGFKKENRIIWCKPSQSFFDKWIAPLIQSYNAERICSDCGGSGQNDPELEHYHALCPTCGGKGRIPHQTIDKTALLEEALIALQALASTARTFRNVPKEEQEWTLLDDEVLEKAFQILEKNGL